MDDEQKTSRPVAVKELYRPPESDLEHKLEQLVISSNQGRPWPRFWARMFDLTLFSVIASFMIYLPLMSLENISVSAQTLLQVLLSAEDQNAALVQWAVYLPSAVVLESVTLAVAGQTPGKWT